MTTIRRTCYIAVLFLLQACASMGKDECLSADWRTIGYEDGTHGLSASQIGEHRKDCAKYGVTPNLQAYLAGRDQGLTQYCNADNGFRVGASGARYAGVCPQRLEGDFLSGYRNGHQLYALNAALRSATSRLDSRRHDLDKINKRLKEESLALVAEKTSTAERIKLLADIKTLGDRKNHVRDEIASLEQERAACEADLSAYRQKLGML